MHILFLSHYFPPEVNAPASRTYDHTRRWVKEPGVRVTVVTNHPNHPKGILYPGYQNRWVTREEVEGVHLIRVKTYLAPNQGFVRRSLNYLFFMIASVIATLWVESPDVVVATSPQFFCAVAGYMASRIKGVPFVFELRDIWPESIVTVGAMKSSLPIRLLEKVELFLYRKATKVVALTDAFKENLVKRGIPSDKIEVIKNGVDLSFFSPNSRPSPLVQELGSDGKFVVSYIGTIGMAHAVDKIVDTAERLRDRKEILFLVVGEGAKKGQIVEQVSQKGLTNIRVLPGVSKEKVRDYYAVTDLNLITLRNTPLFRTVIPSKIFEIMAMERPILCAVDGETRQLVEQAGAGIFVESENVDQMVEVIEKLFLNKGSLIQMGKNGRRFVESHFDRDNLAQNFLGLIKEVAQTDRVYGNLSY
jgi:glycosyltransferase involved in cell wall biosynthesis